MKRYSLILVILVVLVSMMPAGKAQAYVASSDGNEFFNVQIVAPDMYQDGFAYEAEIRVHTFEFARISNAHLQLMLPPTMDVDVDESTQWRLDQSGHWSIDLGFALEGSLYIQTPLKVLWPRVVSPYLLNYGVCITSDEHPDLMCTDVDILIVPKNTIIDYRQLQLIASNEPYDTTGAEGLSAYLHTHDEALPQGTISLYSRQVEGILVDQAIVEADRQGAFVFDIAKIPHNTELRIPLTIHLRNDNLLPARPVSIWACWHNKNYPPICSFVLVPTYDFAGGD